MYLSIGRRLRGLGKIRIGAGFRMKGWTAAIMIFVYAMVYLCWYMMLGTLWLLYGIGYLFIYLPIKGIVKLCKTYSKKKQRADAAAKYTRDNVDS